MQDAVPLNALFEDTSVAFSGKSDEELRKTYLLFQAFNNPILQRIGTGIVNVAFQLRLPVDGMVKRTVYKQFCGGETLQECVPVIERLGVHNIVSALQFSVETKSTEEEFDKITDELLRSIAHAAQNPLVKVICCKPTGIADIQLLERLHAGNELNHEEQRAMERVRQRMTRLCEAAAAADKKLFFDAEETWIQQPLDELTQEMMQRFNRRQPVVYNTYQLYAKTRLAALRDAVNKAREERYMIGVKLVRGAYMEKERIHALQAGAPSPIHENKEATDSAYNSALELCIRNIDVVAINAATHNEASCLQLLRWMNEHGVARNHPHILFSQLYGMGEHITFNLAKAGCNAMKLVPYGAVREAIPYLMRRAAENSSVAGQTGRELNMLQKEMQRRKLQ